LNIAEGSAKKSDRDFAKYLDNSLGSTSECVAALDLALEFKLISPGIFEKYEKDAENIANQLGGFVKKLRS
jgi:four helix bundle protein